jgi:hypothetical protein
VATIEDFAAARARLHEMAVGLEGREPAEHRDRGFHLTGFSVPIYVRIRDVGGPIIGLTAVAAEGVTESVRAFAELRDAAGRLPFGRVRLHEHVVSLCGEVRFHPALDDRTLGVACETLAEAAVDLGERLRAPSPEPLPPSPESPRLIMLP